ncbi:MAG TPA: alpha/beta hydrolase [Anaerolineae bacterium]|nr:alpha/beta hydrolase [Anaerolineae bacterium]
MTTITSSATGKATSVLSRHPLLFFVALTIAIAWPAALLTAVLPYLPLGLIALLSPTIAALLVSPTTKEGALWRVLQFPKGVEWTIIALVPLLVAPIVGYLGTTSAGYAPKYPLMGLLVVTMGTAFLCATAERVAWRGWALPRLFTSLPAILAGLVLAVLMAATYLPLILLPVFQLAPGTFWEHPPLYVSIVIVFAWVWQRVQIAPASTPTATRPRRVLRATAKASLAIPLAIGVLLMTAVVYHAGESRSFPAPAQMVDVGGYSLHIECLGEGSPTVILEAGSLGFSSHWHWVQQELASTNRVCAYDRAGHGWSQPGLQPRDAPQIVRELHTLLVNAHIAGPYVLAGNSYGGRLIINYTASYPDEVLGLVLVDVTPLEPITDETEHQRWVLSGVWDIMDSALLNKTPQALESRRGTWDWLRTFEQIGLYRYMVAVFSQDYPLQQQAEITAIMPGEQNVQAATDEAIDSRPIDKSALPVDSLGDMRLVVQVADHRLSPEELAQFIEGYSQPYLALSTNSRLIVVEDADHSSILAKPEKARQVVAAIREVIEAARSGQPLPSN